MSLSGRKYFIIGDSESTDNSKRFYIDGSSGSVAINTLPDDNYDLTANSNVLVGGNLDVSGDAAISGNLTIDTDTLYVDATNNRVGINKTPSVELDVEGDAAIEGTLHVFNNDSITYNTAYESVIANTGDVVLKLQSGDTSSSYLAMGKYDDELKVGLSYCANSSQSSARYLNFRNGGANRVQISETGDMLVDTDTLYVDATNDRVGINKTPSVALDVDGDAVISGDLTLNSDIIIESGEIIFATKNTSTADKLSIGRYDGSAGNMAINSDGSIHFVETDTDNVVMTMNLNTSRIGIGSSSPSVALDVDGDAAISGDLTVDTNTLYVDATDDKVGIGTDSPDSDFTFHVEGNSYINGEYTVISGGSLFEDPDYVDRTPLVLHCARGSNTDYRDQGKGCILKFSHAVGISNIINGTDDRYCAIRTVSESGFSKDIAMKFSVCNNTTTYVDALYIDPYGNVGIGTNNPSRALDISGDATISGELTISNPGELFFGSSLRQMLNLYSTTYGIGVQSNTLYFRSNKNFAWYKGGEHSDTTLDAAGGSTLMVLTEDGELGINKTPSVALDVDGDAAISGDLTVSTNATISGFLTNRYIHMYNSSDMQHAVVGYTNRMHLQSMGAIDFGVSATTLDGSQQDMRLTSTGLGIGTASPSAKLDVRGDVSISKTLPSYSYDDLSILGGFDEDLSVELTSNGTATFTGPSAKIENDVNFTIVLYFKISDVTVFDSTGNQYIVLNYGGSTVGINVYLKYNAGSWRLYFKFKDGNNNVTEDYLDSDFTNYQDTFNEFIIQNDTTNSNYTIYHSNQNIIINSGAYLGDYIGTNAGGLGQTSSGTFITSITSVNLSSGSFVAYVEDLLDLPELATMYVDGKIGIGVSAPVAKVHIHGFYDTGSSNNNRSMDEMFLVMSSTQQESSGRTEPDITNSEYNYPAFGFTLYDDNNLVLTRISDSGNITDMDSKQTWDGDFTGQHRCISRSYVDDVKEFIGKIVVSSGDYQNIFSKRIKNHINESLPIVSLSSSINQKSAFGVISDKENIEDTGVRMNNSFSLLKSISSSNTRDARLHINSLGEGSIWVSNRNGNIENGDFITTSDIPGYGMKQDDDFLHNYTVAKITCDCDFSIEPIQKEQIRFVDIDQSPNNVSDASSSKIEKVYYDASTNEIEMVPLLDSSGNPIVEYKYNTRFLLPDGTEITKEEYITKLASNEMAYIACFVGCTYHCG